MRKLFTPIHIGKVEIKNRLVQSSMCVFFNAKDGHVNDIFCEYLREHAAGGIGLVMIPGSPHGKVSAGRPALSDDSYIEDWRKISNIAHQYGAKLFCQLHPAKFQAGRGHQVDAPEDYSKGDINRLVESYAAGARRAQLAGVDGVEIHGAHAHEIALFMSPLYNHRKDEYGTDTQGRAKFPSEIIQGIKALCGRDFPVIFRISGNEYVEGGRRIEESGEICKILEKAGADAIHVSAGMPASEGYISAPMDQADGFNVDAAAYIKHQVRIPVIAVNRIVDIKEAEEIVESGKADMAAMARGLLADPELVNKYTGNNPEPVRRCVGCNQGCRDRAARKKIICMQNPFLGYSGERVLKTVTEENKDMKILIAGAGPAGLEIACDLAARGFKPEIYEKENRAGGLLNLASQAPLKNNMDRIREYREEFLKKHGIEIHFNTEVTDAMVEEENPDVLVVATGSHPIIPPIPGINSNKVYVCDDILKGVLPEGRRVAVLGGGLVGCEAADYLAHQGKEVIVIDAGTELAANLNPSRRHFMLERMAKHQVSFMLGRTVIQINLPKLTISSEDREEILDGIEALVVSAGRYSVNRLSALADNESGMKVVTVGDAMKVGLALDAIHQAAAVACEI